MDFLSTHGRGLLEHIQMVPQDAGQPLLPTAAHLDAFGRDAGPIDPKLDHYLRPRDGRLKQLSVQSVDMWLNGRAVSWHRVRITTKATVLTRVLFWIWSQPDDVTATTIRYISGALIMVGLSIFPMEVGGEPRHDGHYDPVTDRDRFYSLSARNRVEDNPDDQMRWFETTRNETRPDSIERIRSDIPNSDSDYPDEGFDYENSDVAYRPLRPRLLCILKSPLPNLEEPESCIQVVSGGDPISYVFISYTRRQFLVGKHPLDDQARRARASLLQFGIKAAIDAGVEAFWLDFKCIMTDDAYDGALPPDISHSNESNLNEEVYQICDIVRGAHSVAVVTGPDNDKKEEGLRFPNRKRWLRDWSWRLWVLPELLLAPGAHDISVYVEALDTSPFDVHPDRIPKRNLAAEACSDAADIRQLIDHYEGSIPLSRLELIRLAVDCLSRRAVNTRTPADLAYALKGLLARRPRRVYNEKGFQAFASLSLANDSQRLLERTICLLPINPEADWFDMRDGWRQKLWDIEPGIQVAGIIDDRSVLIDGAFGASIEWGQLEVVPFIKRKSLKTVVLSIISRVGPLTFTFIGVVFIVVQTTFFIVLGSIFVATAVLAAIMAPWVIYQKSSGKLWETQAWFFGIEGDVSLADIEKKLFGLNEGRLKWSSSGSLLSNHHRDSKTSERVADPPDDDNIRDITEKLRKRSCRNAITRDPAAPPLPPRCGQIANEVDPGASGDQIEMNNINSSQTKQSRFTVIDTFTMTATAFYAFRPPTVVFICGQEGGMQRAVLCSYDFKTHTYCRETVLRMETRVLERMFRANRFRFAFRRPDI